MLRIFGCKELQVERFCLLPQDAFVLTGRGAAPQPRLETRALHCLLPAFGIHVSVRCEPRLAGVWTFFALIGLWGEPGPSSLVRLR